MDVAGHNHDVYPPPSRTSHGLFPRHIYTDTDIPPHRVPFRESQTRPNHHMGPIQTHAQHRHRTASVHFFISGKHSKSRGERPVCAIRPVPMRCTRPPERPEHGCRAGKIPCLVGCAWRDSHAARLAFAAIGRLPFTLGHACETHCTKLFATCATKCLLCIAISPICWERPGRA